MGETNRREFLKKSLVAALVGHSCLSLGFEEALAQSRLSGKPSLTEKNINRLFKDKDANKVFAREMSKNFKSFIESKFTLTKTQSARLALFTREKSKDLKRNLEALKKQGGDITVVFKEESGKGDKDKKKEVEINVKVPFFFEGGIKWKVEETQPKQP